MFPLGVLQYRHIFAVSTHVATLSTQVATLSFAVSSHAIFAVVSSDDCVTWIVALKCLEAKRQAHAFLILPQLPPFLLLLLLLLLTQINRERTSARETGA